MLGSGFASGRMSRTAAAEGSSGGDDSGQIRAAEATTEAAAEAAAAVAKTCSVGVQYTCQHMETNSDSSGGNGALVADQSTPVQHDQRLSSGVAEPTAAEAEATLANGTDAVQAEVAAEAQKQTETMETEEAMSEQVDHHATDDQGTGPAMETDAQEHKEDQSVENNPSVEVETDEAKAPEAKESVELLEPAETDTGSAQEHLSKVQAGEDDAAECGQTAEEVGSKSEAEVEEITEQEAQDREVTEAAADAAETKAEATEEAEAKVEDEEEVGEPGAEPQEQAEIETQETHSDAKQSDSGQAETQPESMNEPNAAAGDTAPAETRDNEKKTKKAPGKSQPTGGKAAAARAKSGPNAVRPAKSGTGGTGPKAALARGSATKAEAAGAAGSSVEAEAAAKPKSKPKAPLSAIPKRPTSLAKAGAETGDAPVEQTTSAGEKSRRNSAAAARTLTSGGGGSGAKEEAGEAKSVGRAARAAAASAPRRLQHVPGGPTGREDEEKPAGADTGRQPAGRPTPRRSLTPVEKPPSVEASSKAAPAEKTHSGRSDSMAAAGPTDHQPGRQRAQQPPRRATVGDAAQAPHPPKPPQHHPPQPAGSGSGSASASADSVRESSAKELHRSNSSQLSKPESGGSNEVFPDGGCAGQGKHRGGARVLHRVTQRTPDCAELQHVTRVTPLPETRTVEIKQTAASRGRLQKLQEEANRVLEASNENQYLTPLQRKESEVKELRQLLQEAYQTITEREEEIDAAAKAKAAEIESAVKDKEEDIAELQSEVEQLSLDYQALAALHGEVKRREEELEREVAKLRQEMEDREARHQRYYLEMYRKGQESAKFERQDELEKLAVQEPDKVSIEELVEKLELTQQDLHKWQTLKLMETYTESEQPATEADAKLRFLRDSMFHYLTEKDRDQGLQHLTAIIGIFNFTEVQMATIMKCLTDRKKKGKI